jgi:hypothetical protein
MYQQKQEDDRANDAHDVVPEADSAMQEGTRGYLGAKVRI